MRILLFSTAYLPHIGGAEMAVKEITGRLPDISFDLITARLKKGLPDFEKIGNVSVHRIGAGNEFLDKPLLPNLGFLKALRLYKKNKYDLIHGIMASQGSAAAYLFKFFYPKVPFLLTLQEGDLGRNSPFDKFWQRRIIRKADAITAISSYLAEFARKLNKKAPIYLIPNGADSEKFKVKKPGEGSREAGIASEKLKTTTKNLKTIVTVSRLVKKNGVDVLIKAVSKLPITNYQLLIIGDGKERKKLVKLVKNLGIEDKVRFLGEMPGEKTVGYLAEADVFVRPSRTEGLGSAFLEAMAAGVPVIGTPVGGIPDFLKDGETGLFCESENPSDLAEKISMILKDDNLSGRLAENGRKTVKEKYNWDAIAEEMNKAYEEIIRNNSGL